jgi:hypothetical protein
VVRGKAATAATAATATGLLLLVLVVLVLVIFCCLFEEERVIAGIEQLRNLELEQIEYKEKKINF